MFEFEETIENSDDTVTVKIRMSRPLMNSFAKIAIRDALEYAIRNDAVDDLVANSSHMGLYDPPPDKIDDKDEIECRSRNPAKTCDHCTCWKNQNE